MERPECTMILRLVTNCRMESNTDIEIQVEIELRLRYKIQGGLNFWDLCAQNNL